MVVENFYWSDTPILYDACLLYLTICSLSFAENPSEEEQTASDRHKDITGHSFLTMVIVTRVRYLALDRRKEFGFLATYARLLKPFGMAVKRETKL